MKVGDRILFIGRPGVRSELKGLHGHIVQVTPSMLATLGGDPRPLLVGRDEIVLDEEAKHHGGAE